MATADPSSDEDGAARLARLRFKAPLFVAMAQAANRAVNVTTAKGQAARAARVGRDDGVCEARDYGPGLRLRDVPGPLRGVLLRAADVAIESVADPNKPQATIRRARRVDPLAALRRAGTITKRQFDAAELLRESLEGAEAPSPCTGQSGVRVAGYQHGGIADHVLRSRTQARKALAVVDRAGAPVLLWIVLGGTITSYSKYAHMRHTVAAKRLQIALSALSDYYFGKKSTHSEPGRAA